MAATVDSILQALAHATEGDFEAHVRIDPSDADGDLRRIGEQVNAVLAAMRKLAAKSTQLRRATAETSRLFETTLRAVPSGVVIVEAATTRVIFSNAPAFATWRLAPDDRLADTLATTRGLALDGRAYAYEDWPLLRTLATGEVVSNEEVRVARPDHADAVYRISSAPVRDPSGAIVAGVAIFDDVTAIRRLDEERTQALVTAQAAVQASQLKSEFLANTSHEIRTPMNAVIGMTSLLLDAGLTDEQRHAVEIIRSSGEHLLMIINDILDYSKIEAGRMLIERSPFFLEDCVASSIDLVAQQAANRDVTVAHTIRTGTPEAVIGDVGRIRQVLVNLLSNAVKFTEPGGKVRVLVSAEERGNELELRFEVRDTGIGMRPEVLRDLFRPFTQADASTTRKFGGTGLGLSICKRLVELMGGAIEVESTLGQGSAFRFTVESAVSTTVPSSSRASSNPGQALRKLATERPLRILVAEDNPVNQKVTRLMLQRLGYGPDVVADGAEAIASLERQIYDVVLMDVQMPVLDGLAASAEIARRWLPDDRPRIVAMTGNASAEDQAACLAAGMDDYVTKPVTLDRLIEALSRCRRRRSTTTFGLERFRRSRSAPTKSAPNEETPPFRAGFLETNREGWWSDHIDRPPSTSIVRALK